MAANATSKIRPSGGKTDLKKSVKELKPSKPLLLFTRSYPREKLKIHGEQHRGWNRLVRDKKRKKEKNHEEKRGANGRRNEERKTR